MLINDKDNSKIFSTNQIMLSIPKEESTST